MRLEMTIPLFFMTFALATGLLSVMMADREMWGDPRVRLTYVVLRPLHMNLWAVIILGLMDGEFIRAGFCAIEVFGVAAVGASLHPFLSVVHLSRGLRSAKAQEEMRALPTDVKFLLVDRAVTFLTILSLAAILAMLFHCAWRWYAALPTSIFIATIIGSLLRFGFGSIGRRSYPPGAETAGTVLRT